MLYIGLYILEIHLQYIQLLVFNKHFSPYFITSKWLFFLTVAAKFI